MSLNFWTDADERGLQEIIAATGRKRRRAAALYKKFYNFRTERCDTEEAIRSCKRRSPKAKQLTLKEPPTELPSALPDPQQLELFTLDGN
jgi:hypothetical protein